MINVELLKKIVENHGLTLGQLSVKSGISKSQLSRVLNGKRNAGAKTISGLAKAFPEPENLFIIRELDNIDNCGDFMQK